MIVEALLGCVLLFLLYKNFSKPASLPPGTFGLPVIGDVRILGTKLTQYALHMREKYGNIFTSKLGSKVFVFMTDYDIIKKAFNHPQMQGRMETYANEVILGAMNGGILFAEDNLWHKNRRFMLRNLKDLGLGKSSLEISIQDEVTQLVKYLNGQDLCKPVKIDWFMNISVLNIIWQLLASKRFEPDDPVITRFVSNMNEDVKIIRGLVSFLSLFPSLPKFLISMFTQVEIAKEHKKEYNEMFMATILDHLKTLDKDNPRDFIDYYLIELENDEEMKKLDNRKYDDLLVIISDMFVAGSETTASTLRWFILLMALNPHVQQKVHATLDANVPDRRQPRLEDRPNLEYLEAVIMETLRYSSLVPTGLTHRVSQEMNFEGYTLPKGTHLQAALEVVHRDPKFWEKPYEFYPEHFLSKDGKLLTKKEGFVPFSIGKRQCLGESLARLELFLFTSILLQKFRIVAPPGVELDDGVDGHAYSFNQCKPYQVMLERRE